MKGGAVSTVVMHCIRIAETGVRFPHGPHTLNLANWTNLDFDNRENFANMMICLCYKQGYLMDQFLRAKQEKFVKEGGFRENQFKKRHEYKSKFGKLI